MSIVQAGQAKISQAHASPPMRARDPENERRDCGSM